MGVDRSWPGGGGERDKRGILLPNFLCMRHMRHLRLVPNYVRPRVVFLQPEFALWNLS